LQTATGQHRRFAMNDGSQIELNTHSRAIVRYAPAQRDIVLVDGEGYFEVAKDRNRPFTVIAGNTSVRAVGTRFSVQRRADGRVDVIVSEGVVQVTQQALHAQVAANEALAAADGKLAVTKVNPEKIARLMAWQQGRVDFDATPLSAALAEMNRYAATPMTAGDAGAAAVRVSGSFSTQNVDAFRRSLELGFGLKVIKRGDGYVILSRSRT
jgi:transmembrane sensor